jgi:hypothetical protein
MKWGIALVMASLFLNSAAYAVRPAYPIRNHIFDHTKQFEYHLGDDHRIRLRYLLEDNLRTVHKGDLVAYPEAQSWHLFDQLGYPFKNGLGGTTRSILDENEYLSEISVASEIVVGVTNLDRVYLYKPTVLKRPIGWSAKLGAPFSGKLYLPQKRRAWTFSVSVRDKDIRNVEFMDESERVIYYTDENGVNFDFGFTATIYVLLEDGRRIVYWDTGLPPSFSRGFLTPEEGQTQGQSISAAGSTIFISVLDNQGRLRFFTRMYDYEINGACPGLTYTYESRPASSAGRFGETVPLGFGERKLPLEGWREHPTDGIPTRNLTSLVSIHLTGRGNSNRELRIQGIDSDGRLGYYYKGIDEKRWNFQVSGDVKGAPRIQFPFNPEVSPMVKNYAGQVLKAKVKGFQTELKSFHPFLTAEEPSKLVVDVGGDSTEIELHSVDGWTITSHDRHYEDLIGVEEGEPKPLQATVILTPDQLNCNKESRLCQVLNGNFLPYHGKVNAFQLVATNESVYVRANNGKLKLYYTREQTEKELHSSFFIKRAREAVSIPAPRGKAAQLSLIEMLQKTSSDLAEIERDYSHDMRKFTAVNSVSTIALPVAKAVFNFNKKDPTYEKAVEDLKSPLRSQVSSEWWDLRKKNKTFKAAQAILNARVLELEVLAGVK